MKQALLVALFAVIVLAGPHSLPRKGSQSWTSSSSSDVPTTYTWSPFAAASTDPTAPPAFFLDIVNDGYSSNLYYVSLFGYVNVVNAAAVNSSEPRTFMEFSFLGTAGPVPEGQATNGLYSIAFHPEFKKNGVFFAAFTPPGEELTITVARYGSTYDETTEQWTGVPESELEIIVIDIEDENFGGHLRFGPDGYLYISVGSEGTGVSGSAQDLTVLAGKVLRIEVDAEEPGYTIPESNPFYVSETSESSTSSSSSASSSDVPTGARPEIFAIGFRHPFKFDFDCVTGRLILTDAGTNIFEEINNVKSGRNYGFPIVEGYQCFDGSDDCNIEDYSSPINGYHQDITRAIVGGFVYRGSKEPELVGKYIYGDFATGNIYAVGLDKKKEESVIIGNVGPFGLTTFGQDINGNIYIATIPGNIVRLGSFELPEASETSSISSSVSSSDMPEIDYGRSQCAKSRSRSGKEMSGKKNSKSGKAAPRLALNRSAPASSAFGAHPIFFGIVGVLCALVVAVPVVAVIKRRQSATRETSPLMDIHTRYSS